MIARSPPVVEPATWQRELRAAYRDPHELLADLGLDAASVGLDAAAEFPFRVTRAYASRIEHRAPHDPLLRQVLPSLAERAAVPGYSSDPLAERERLHHGSLIQKYQGRALLLVSGACAIHCRYCFRREFPYGQSVGRDQLADGLRQIAADSTLTEIILSGGDPLVLDDEAISGILAALAAIEHVARVRVHTRLPVVLPSRITPRLLRALSAQRYPAIVVVHVNHAREIDAEVRLALAACRQTGLTVLNQSVLLHGVNDNVTALVELSEALFAAGVMPYYVNVLDRVNGTAHFDTGDASAAELERQMRAHLPGYLVPRFVREVPGAVAKLPLAEIGRDRAGSA